MVTLTNAGADVFRERVINQFGFDQNDLGYFKTLHKIAWSLCGMNHKNIFGRDHQDIFTNMYYPTNKDKKTDYDPDLYRITSSDRSKLDGVGKLNQMVEIRDCMMETMIDDYNFDKMHKMTGRGLNYRQYYVNDTVWSDKHNKYQFIWGHTQEQITEQEQIEFSDRLTGYLTDNDLHTYSDSIRMVYDNHLAPPVEYLFLDEFQDFTKLQYECMCRWMDAQHIQAVWAAGDDAHTLYRFAGADAAYMVNMPHTDAVFLPQIYRYGQAIANNAKPYIDRMSIRVDGDAAPCDKRGDVIRYYDGSWTDTIKIAADGRSVLILAATKQWVNSLLPIFANLSDDAVTIVRLENAAKIERVFQM